MNVFGSFFSVHLLLRRFTDERKREKIYVVNRPNASYYSMKRNRQHCASLNFIWLCVVVVFVAAQLKLNIFMWFFLSFIYSFFLHLSSASLVRSVPSLSSHFTFLLFFLSHKQTSEENRNKSEQENFRLSRNYQIVNEWRRNEKKTNAAGIRFRVLFQCSEQRFFRFRFWWSKLSGNKFIVN